NLDALTRDLELDQFVLFSSAAASIGSPGQANYAAANAFLDALAERRRAEGLAATAVAWAPWASIGMGERARGSRNGIAPLSAEEGLALFDAARASDAPFVVAAKLDTAALHAQARAAALPAVLQKLVRLRARRAQGGAGALSRRLAGLPRDEWDAVLLELVRSETAAVLGHGSPEQVEPDQALLELGFESLAAVELRNRLGQATGLRLPSTLVFDHATPAALAGHLRERLERNGLNGAAGASAEPESAAGTLSTLLRHAHEHDTMAEALVLLMEASRFRPAFQSAEELDVASHATSITTGPTPPKLICIPSFLVGSGPHQFARLAQRLGQERSVCALSLPGFRAGDPLPASWDAAIGALAGAVRHAADGDPFALVGYSGGGALAHAVAQTLEEEETAPSGVVMVDTYAPEGEQILEVVAAVMGHTLDRGHEFISLDDDSLTAMGAYMRLFTDWEPGPIEAPRVLIRASEQLGDARSEDGGMPAWQAPESIVEVTGDHFGLIEQNAEGTARAIEAWLADQAGVPAPAFARTGGEGE
ncbi:MAG TPA: alpha/beta fold hydrolase, partial [Thermoleophilaceae bacterium]